MGLQGCPVASAVHIRILATTTGRSRLFSEFSLVLASFAETEDAVPPPPSSVMRLGSSAPEARSTWPAACAGSCLAAAPDFLVSPLLARPQRVRFTNIKQTNATRRPLEEQKAMK